eukprot:Amastigsp_a346871_124.p3 type:complete len:106 gc:universal Amastigsp_a346871_124:405-722(+)
MPPVRQPAREAWLADDDSRRRSLCREAAPTLQLVARKIVRSEWERQHAAQPVISYTTDPRPAFDSITSNLFLHVQPTGSASLFPSPRRLRPRPATGGCTHFKRLR